MVEITFPQGDIENPIKPVEIEMNFLAPIEWSNNWILTEDREGNWWRVLNHEGGEASFQLDHKEQTRRDQIDKLFKIAFTINEAIGLLEAYE